MAGADAVAAFGGLDAGGGFAFFAHGVFACGGEGDVFAGAFGGAAPTAEADEGGLGGLLAPGGQGGGGFFGGEGADGAAAGFTGEAFGGPAVEAADDHVAGGEIDERNGGGGEVGGEGVVGEENSGGGVGGDGAADGGDDGGDDEVCGEVGLACIDRAEGEVCEGAEKAEGDVEQPEGGFEIGVHGGDGEAGETGGCESHAEGGAPEEMGRVGLGAAGEATALEAVEHFGFVVTKFIEAVVVAFVEADGGDTAGGREEEGAFVEAPEEEGGGDAGGGAEEGEGGKERGGDGGGAGEAGELGGDVFEAVGKGIGGLAVAEDGDHADADDAGEDGAGEGVGEADAGDDFDSAFLAGEEDEDAIVFGGAAEAPFVEAFGGIVAGAHAGDSGDGEDDDLGIGAAVDALEDSAEAGVIGIGEHGGFVGHPGAGDGGVGGGLSRKGPNSQQNEKCAHSAL